MKKFEFDWPYMRRGLVPIAIGSGLAAFLLLVTMMLESSAAGRLETNLAVLDDLQRQGNEIRGKLTALERKRSRSKSKATSKREVELSSFRGKKPVVLIFGSFT